MKGRKIYRLKKLTKQIGSKTCNIHTQKFVFLQVAKKIIQHQYRMEGYEILHKENHFSDFANLGYE